MSEITVNLDECREQALEACRTLAPADLADRPFYIVYASEIPGGLNQGAIGITSPVMDAALEDVLGERWAGRGPALVVGDETIIEESDKAMVAAGLTETAEPALAAAVRYRMSCLAAEAVLAVAVHELAHLVSWDHDYAAEVPQAQAQESRAAVGETREYVGAGLILSGHDWRFIRAAMHLRYRAKLAGKPEWGGHLRLEGYGLAATALYEAVLAEECEAMEGASFAEIRAAAVPASFAALWNDDVRAWMGKDSENAAGLQAMLLPLPQSPAAVGEGTGGAGVEGEGEEEESAEQTVEAVAAGLGVELTTVHFASVGGN